MKYILFIIIIIQLLFGCGSHSKFELEIVTKEINYLDVDESRYIDFVSNDSVKEPRATTIIVYKLTNNSASSYYFNIDGFANDMKNNYIKLDRAFIGIYDKNGKYQKPRVGMPSTNTDIVERQLVENLDYKYANYVLHDNSKNFIIHPNETLYFEYFIILPFGHLLDGTNYTLTLDKQKEYFAEVLINSDSTNYKDLITRTDLRTIEENGYKVFNGTITSKNKVPLIFNSVKDK